MEYSLSRYFPKGTEYFYYFPNDEVAKFFSYDSPSMEELFATPPLICAGKNVKPVIFGSLVGTAAWNILYKDLKTCLPNNKSIVVLPKNINGKVVNKKRTTLIKKSLKSIITPGKLIMSQPFLDDDLKTLFQIPPNLSAWLNDKKNISKYVPTKNCPKHYEKFLNGKDFDASSNIYPYPFVIKVSASAAGEGVLICKNFDDLKFAKEKFILVKTDIFIEEFIDYVFNIGIQFGIPHNPKKRIEILGINEQITSNNGEYLGSIIDSKRKIKGASKACDLFLTKILPKIRKMGWYGVGSFDVLIDKNGNSYFIDCNFRMTAMTAYFHLLRSSVIKGPVATFTGTYHGSENNFRKHILPIAKNSRKQRIKIIILTKNNGTYHFGAIILLKNIVDLPSTSKQLLDIGIKSSGLEHYIQLS